MPEFLEVTGITDIHKHSPYTIAIIGGGLSALVILLTLTRELSGRQARPKNSHSILLVDKNPQNQFGRGLAYAAPWSREHPLRAGSRAELLNSPASRMGLESVIGEAGKFVDWLREHENRWQPLLGLMSDVTGELLQPPAPEDWPDWEAPAIARWLAFNREKLEARAYETVYFPRSVYGEFIDDLAADALAQAEACGIELRHLQAHVENIVTADGGNGPFELAVQGESVDGQVTASRLIYSGGDLPASSLGANLPADSALVERPYGTNPTRHERHNTLLEGVNHAAEDKVKLLLAGSNACAMDQLWALDNNPHLRDALRQGRLQIVMVSPHGLPHPGTVLLPAPEDEPADPLRWLQAEQQILLDEVVERHLNPDTDFSAASYVTALGNALQDLRLGHNPHLFMVFLRRLGEVEQTIRDRLPDITEFARDFHDRIEELILFTPCEYWQGVMDMASVPGALQQVTARVVQIDQGEDQLRVTLDNGDHLSCNMAINCTGPRNPFSRQADGTLLGQLLEQQLGAANTTGGLRTSTEGRLQHADGSYCQNVYLCTQNSQGLQQPAAGGKTRFVSANRLTAVRIAEQAGRIALDLARNLS